MNSKQWYMANILGHFIPIHEKMRIEYFSNIRMR